MATKAKRIEKEYYQAVMDWLGSELRDHFNDFHLEITADRKFSNKLKGQIGKDRNIIFLFLKGAAPDITGFLRGKYSPEFIVAEVKDKPIKLRYIYQVKMYAELFDAQYAILVSTEEIPVEIIRLSEVVFSLFQLPSYRKKFCLVRFDKEEGKGEWFPENPFLTT